MMRLLPLVAAAAVFGRHSTAPVVPPAVHARQRQLLAAHQYTVNFKWLGQNPEAADNLSLAAGFDGTTIRFTNNSLALIHSNVSADEAAIRSEMMLASGKLRHLTQNWVVINAGVTAPFSEWDRVVIPNWRKLARSAAAAGLSGVYLDTEDYNAEGGGRPVWWSPKTGGLGMCPDSNPNTWSCGHPGPSVPFGMCPLMVQCRKEALEAGRAVMSAVIEEWPSARIMTTFGPWVSDNRTGANGISLNPPTYRFSWRQHPVVGAFAAGLAAGTLGTAAQYIDGMEMYTQNTASDVARMRAWAKGECGTAPCVNSTCPATQPYMYGNTSASGTFCCPTRVPGAANADCAQPACLKGSEPAGCACCLLGSSTTGCEGASKCTGAPAVPNGSIACSGVRDRGVLCKTGGMAQSQFVVDNNLSAAWPTILTFGPGVYDFPGKFQGKGPGSARMWQNDLTISLNGTDPGGVTWACASYADVFLVFAPVVLLPTHCTPDTRPVWP
jgi:hypothetical protein